MRLEYSDNETSWFEADQQVRCGNKVTGVFEERGQRVSEHIETSGFAVPTSSSTAALPSVETAYSHVKVSTVHQYISYTLSNVFEADSRTCMQMAGQEITVTFLRLEGGRLFKYGSHTPYTH